PALPSRFTLYLHDALPICICRSFVTHVHGIADILENRADSVIGRLDEILVQRCSVIPFGKGTTALERRLVKGAEQVRDVIPEHADRKSTRLNSSHVSISYA